MARVLDMYCVKPIDEAAVIKAAKETKAIVTVEEHTIYGGLGSMISQITAAHCPTKVINMALPDAPVVTGKSQEVFDHYGLNAKGIAKTVMELI
jgi:transketolase